MCQTWVSRASSIGMLLFVIPPSLFAQTPSSTCVSLPFPSVSVSSTDPARPSLLVYFGRGFLETLSKRERSHPESIRIRLKDSRGTVHTLTTVGAFNIDTGYAHSYAILLRPAEDLTFGVSYQLEAKYRQTGWVFHPVPERIKHWHLISTSREGVFDPELPWKRPSSIKAVPPVKWPDGFKLSRWNPLKCSGGARGNAGLRFEAKNDPGSFGEALYYQVWLASADSILDPEAPMLVFQQLPCTGDFLRVFTGKSNPCEVSVGSSAECGEFVTMKLPRMKIAIRLISERGALSPFYLGEVGDSECRSEVELLPVRDSHPTN